MAGKCNFRPRPPCASRDVSGRDKEALAKVDAVAGSPCLHRRLVDVDGIDPQKSSGLSARPAKVGKVNSTAKPRHKLVRSIIFARRCTGYPKLASRDHARCQRNGSSTGKELAVLWCDRSEQIVNEFVLELIGGLFGKSDG